MLDQPTTHTTLPGLHPDLLAIELGKTSPSSSPGYPAERSKHGNKGDKNPKPKSMKQQQKHTTT